MDWAYVLVIILSIFLAIFLLLGIILTILLIRVSLQIKAISESARRTTENFEEMVNNANKFTGPGLAFRSFYKQFKKFKKEK